MVRLLVGMGVKLYIGSLLLVYGFVRMDVFRSISNMGSYIHQLDSAATFFG